MGTMYELSGILVPSLGGQMESSNKQVTTSGSFLLKFI